MMSTSNQNEHRKESVYGIAVFCACAAGAGSGTTSQWTTAGLEELLSVPYLGSLLIGTLGLVTGICVLIGLKNVRAWGVILLGYLLDMILSVAFIWPIRDYAISDPFGPWPYVLGALATVCAGIAVGLLGSQAPVRHALGLVALDFLLTGIIGLAAPQGLSWKLASRIPVAYCSAIFGALIGQYICAVIATNRLSVGRFFARLIAACLASVAGGLLTKYVVELIQ